MIVSGSGSAQHLKIVRDDLQKWNVYEGDTGIQYISDYINELIAQKHRDCLSSFRTFLPPRLVSAAKNGALVVFFGSGISVGAGVPTWNELLERLGVPPEFSKEPQLENDPLTTAELLAHEIGASELQKQLRRVMLKPGTPTLVHCLLAQMSQPIYVTTNYDTLFEIAWRAVHGGDGPVVITTDADFAKLGLNVADLRSISERPVLLKVHGCARRDDEEMILTRSQYRRHYRSNTMLFDALKALLSQKHTLFLGFGHRDPEITRLVEDVIHSYESDQGSPALYSLQFDMKERTPEVFAARGIVALQPPLSLNSPTNFDHRSASLTKALADLNGAMDSDAHNVMDLDTSLARYIDVLSTELTQAMKILQNSAGLILDNLHVAHIVHETLSHLLSELGALAGQGIYLLKPNGDIQDCALPPLLTFPGRRTLTRLHDRFYVQQARTFRKAFVSDSAKSVYNGQSTFFLCCPLGNMSQYRGLLFSAAQVGTWQTPLQLKTEFLRMRPEGSFVLLDSNGIVLLPPNTELEPHQPSKQPETEIGSEANLGFDYNSLHRISRRDKLVSRMWRNIVPLAQDDDVEVFSDLRMYSVVSEIAPSRWKLALSIPYDQIDTNVIGR